MVEDKTEVKTNKWRRWGRNHVMWTCFSGQCTAGQWGITGVTYTFQEDAGKLNYDSGVKLFGKGG